MALLNGIDGPLKQLKVDRKKKAEAPLNRTASIFGRRQSMYQITNRINLCTKALAKDWALATVGHDFDANTLESVPDGVRIRDLKKGEIVFVVEQHKSGWWRGMNSLSFAGGTFIFPGSFVSIAGTPRRIVECVRKPASHPEINENDVLLVLDQLSNNRALVYHSRLDAISTIELHLVNKQTGEGDFEVVKESAHPAQPKKLTESNLIEFDNRGQGGLRPPAERAASRATSVASKSWRETRSVGGAVKSFASQNAAAAGGAQSRQWKVTVQHGIRYRHDPHLGAVTHPVQVAAYGTICIGDENADNWLETDGGLWLPIRIKDQVLLANASKDEAGYAAVQSNLTYEDIGEIQAFKENYKTTIVTEELHEAPELANLLKFSPSCGPKEIHLLLSRIRAKYPEYFDKTNGALTREVDAKLAAVVYYHAGLLAVGIGKFAMAVDMFKRAITKKPAKQAYFNLAYVRQIERKEKAGAMKHYQNAIRMDQNFTKAMFFLAALLADEHGRYDDAISMLERCVKLEPKLVPAHFSLARLLQDYRRDAEGAARHYNACLGLDPYHYDARYNLALILWETGQHSAAKFHFEECKKAGPRYAPILNDLAKFLMDELGDLQGSEALYLRLLQIQPDHPEGQFGLAQLVCDRDPMQADRLLRNIEQAYLGREEYGDLRRYVNSLLDDPARAHEEVVVVHRASGGGGGPHGGPGGGGQQKPPPSGCCVIL